MGYQKMMLRGERDNPVSIPVLKDPVAMARIVSVSSSTVFVNGSVWVRDEFSFIPGIQNNTYVLEFISGDLRGVEYKVVGNTESALVLEVFEDDLTQHPRGVVRVGDLFQVRPLWGLGEVFGSTDDSAILEPLTSPPQPDRVNRGDGVLFPDQQRVGTDKKPLHTFHYMSGGGWRDPETLADHTFEPIPQGGALLVRKQSVQDGELVLLGEALRRPLISRIRGDSERPNDHWIGISFAEPKTLDESGLANLVANVSALKLSPNPNELQDELMVWGDLRKGFDREASRTFIFLDGEGWKELGSESLTSGVDFHLEPGKAYLIRKQAGSPSADWTQKP
jgi:uncharacterized protein (TIGR02597 family)